jgi:peptidyl-prolyl cis-trans isomerase D
MLLKLREKTTGWIAGAIVILITIPFVLVGIGDYFSTRTDIWVAKVGEVEISADEFRSRFEEYRQQVRRSMGDAYDARQLESAGVKRRVLDRMVDEELLRQAASQLGIVVPANRLQREIARISAFHVDGNFDPAQYRLLLSSQGMSPRGFEQRLRRDLEANALPAMISESAFASSADIDRFIALRDQRRDARYLLIDGPPLAQIDAPDEAAIEAFYAEHADRYMTEEQVEIEYVLLDSAALDIPAEADEQTLRQRYDEQRIRYVEPEQRLASHLLIRLQPNADADAQRDAQMRAATLATQARAADADFAELAREHSQDPGSRATGGDLGWIEPGITDPAFETALFAMQPGSISDPVRSEEGWHVIQLREVRPGKELPFEEVRDELAAEFTETERERVFNELAGRLVDAIYRDPTSLQTSADELGLDIQRAGPFGRAGGDSRISSHPAVLDAAFSEEVLVEGNVSDLLDLGEGRVAALRLVEHLRARPVPLDEIRDQVAAEWHEAQHLARAQASAEQALQQVLQGASLDDLAADGANEVQVAEDVGRIAAGIDPAIAAELFRLPHPEADAPTFGNVDLGAGRHALIELRAVRDGDPSAVSNPERNALRDQLGQLLAASEVEGMMQALRAEIPVRVAEERLQ